MITEWAHIFLSTIIHKEFCSNNADKLCSVYTLALFWNGSEMTDDKHQTHLCVLTLHWELLLLTGSEGTNWPGSILLWKQDKVAKLCFHINFTYTRIHSCIRFRINISWINTITTSDQPIFGILQISASADIFVCLADMFKTFILTVLRMVAPELTALTFSFFVVCSHRLTVLSNTV